MHLEKPANLETPCVIIDANIMERNIHRMNDIIKKSGVSLRPHAKTHKIPAIAKRQLEAGAVGITVAKPSEAEIMAEHGIRSIFIAYPIVIPSKIERVLRLSRQEDIIVGVDSLEGAKRLSDASAAHGQTLAIRLEIDTGLKRTGVAFDDAVKFAYEINKLPNLLLSGIFTFRGALLGGKSTLDFRGAGHEEGRLMVQLAEEIRKQGIALQDVSVGSTPTSPYAAEIAGVTEVRPGTYVYYDQMMTQMGVCGPDDCAATVMASVISRPSADYAVIDAGSKALATDVAPNVAPLHLQGYGRIIGFPGAVLERLNEEHGMIRLNGSGQPQIGDTLHIVPNHICSTINLHNSVYLQSGDTVEEMPVLARGKLQ